MLEKAKCKYSTTYWQMGGLGLFLERLSRGLRYFMGLWLGEPLAGATVGSDRTGRGQLSPDRNPLK